MLLLNSVLPTVPVFAIDSTLSADAELTLADFGDNSEVTIDLDWHTLKVLNQENIVTSWILVDHTNFATARNDQLVDYYNNFPTEAAQDGEDWPPFTPSKFPWFVINGDNTIFDENNELNFYFQWNNKLQWTPSAQVENESGSKVDRTYAIASVPEDFGLTQYVETTEWTETLPNSYDFYVESIPGGTRDALLKTVSFADSNDAVELTFAKSEGKIVLNEPGDPEWKSCDWSAEWYTFWQPITSDITLVADCAQKYTITWVVDGTTTTGEFASGEMPAYEWTPTKDGSTFRWWDPELTEVVWDATYTAIFKRKSSSSSNSDSSSSSSSWNGSDSASVTTWDTATATDGADSTEENNSESSEEWDNNEGAAWTDNDGANSNAGDSEDAQNQWADKYNEEFHNAYDFAFKNGITTMPSIDEADMESPLTRIAMAKMLSQYAINILKKTPDTSKTVSFPDVSAELDEQYDNGVTLAYQLWIMWIWIEEFRPFDEVTRAEFVTALSRMLYWLSDGEELYYETHMQKLLEEKIITVADPDLQELRGYVMIMLMRSAENND